MERRQDIGKAFRDKMDTLQRSPDDALWQSINAAMARKKRRKTILWWSISGIAFVASLLLLLILLPGDSKHTTPPTSGQDNETINHQSKNGQNHIKNGTRKVFGKTVEESTKIPVTTLEGPDSTVGNTETLGNEDSDYGKKAGVSTVTPQRDNSLTKNNISGTSPRQGKATSGAAAQQASKAARDKKTLETPVGTADSIQNVSGNIRNEDMDLTGSKLATRKKEPNGAPQHVGNSGIAVQPSASVGTGKENDNIAHSQIRKNNDMVADDSKVGKLVESENGTDSSPKTQAEGNSVSSGTATANDNLPDAAAEALTSTILTSKDSLTARETENNKDSVASASASHRRFFVYAHLDAARYRQSSEGSLVGSWLDTNSVATDFPLHYGIYAGYAISKRLAIRTGIMVKKVTTTTYNVDLEVGDNQQFPDFEHVAYKDGFSNQFLSGTFGYQGYTIVQKASFLEIPLEASYAIFSGKMGLSATAGVSILLVQENNVNALHEMGNTYLGKLNTLKSSSVGYNMGLTACYEFLPGLRLNAEPVFRYYPQTVEGHKFYSFGIQAGLQYSFGTTNEKK